MTNAKIKNMVDFAGVSGISRPTVSKYFNDPSSVRASTRERIEKALEEYDYRPNMFAMNQNRKLTRNIGIVVPYLADPFFAEIARTIEQRCIDAGYRPTLYSSHGEQDHENDILDSLRSLKPAGVLFSIRVQHFPDWWCDAFLHANRSGRRIGPLGGRFCSTSQRCFGDRGPASKATRTSVGLRT